MKKIKLTGKLNLNKTTISKLNDDEMNGVQGGILSITKACTKNEDCFTSRRTRGIFCNDLVDDTGNGTGVIHG